MKRVKIVRDRLNSQAQWIQLGVLTASILTPLINRWNELRAMEQAQAIREDVEERIQRLRAAPLWNRRHAEQAVEEVLEEINSALPQPRRAPKSSTVFWIAGVGLGIIAAGVGTYLVVKRRMVSYREEPLVPLPFRRPGTPIPPYFTPTPTGSADDATASMTSMTSSTSSMNGFSTHDDSAAVGMTADGQDGTDMPDIEGAAVVGNIRTMAYHLPGDEYLPEEDNRVYFSSEEEARQAGFHFSSGEISAAENNAGE
jgi:hypothetical protein